MAKPTQSLTTDQVLDRTRFHDSRNLANYESRLTAATKEIDRLLNGGFGSLLGIEEQQALQDAAAAIRTIRNRVEHAKEIKRREEKAARARQEERDRQARRLVAEAYPLPLETPQHRLEIIKLALVLNRAGHYLPFYSELELNQKLRTFVTQASWQIITSHPGDHEDTLEARLANKVSYFRVEIIRALEQHLAYDDETAVPARLDALQHELADLGNQVLSTKIATETLRLWAEALQAGRVQP
ncbi:hypothetical protein [Azotobacter vinelandii]|uniref:hypothetical protein n=1 Tax=Azotobacter vinelandii TaxID=354 RepID=UPI00077317ED|nr:hypothetical protein [Azotobacter vinelandii]